MIRHFLLTSIFLFCAPHALGIEPDPRCWGLHLERLKSTPQELVSEWHQEGLANAKQKSAPGVTPLPQRLLYRGLDAARMFIQRRINHRETPTIVMDNGTVFGIELWSKEHVGFKLSEKETALKADLGFDPAKILDRIEAYPEQMAQMEARVATLHAQIQILRDFKGIVKALGRNLWKNEAPRTADHDIILKTSAESVPTGTVMRAPQTPPKETVSLPKEIENFPYYFPEGQRAKQRRISLKLPLLKPKITSENGRVMKVDFELDPQGEGMALGTPAEISNKIRELKAEKKSLLGGLFKNGKIADLAYDQTIAIKQMELVREELTNARTQAQTRGQEIPAQATTFEDRIHAIADEVATDRHSVRRPPWKAFTRLKGRQFWEELKVKTFDDIVKSIVEKSTSGDPDSKTKMDRFREFLETLPEHRRQKFGLEHGKKYVHLFKYSRWGAIILGTTATGFTGTTLLERLYTGTYNWLYFDEDMRLECAQKSSDDEFVNCAATFLQAKFLKSFVLSNDLHLYDYISKYYDKKKKGELPEDGSLPLEIYNDMERVHPGLRAEVMKLIEVRFKEADKPRREQLAEEILKRYILTLEKTNKNEIEQFDSLMPKGAAPVDSNDKAVLPPEPINQDLNQDQRVPSTQSSEEDF